MASAEGPTQIMGILIARKARHAKRIRSGSAPVKDQSGAVKIAAGTTPTIDFLESINWLAEGVIGTLPKN